MCRYDTNYVSTYVLNETPTINSMTRSTCIHFTLLAYISEQMCLPYCILCLIPCVLQSTCRTNITAHISLERINSRFFSSTYCYISFITIYAPEMSHISNINKLLHVHQWGGMPNTCTYKLNAIRHVTTALYTDDNDVNNDNADNDTNDNTALNCIGQMSQK